MVGMMNEMSTFGFHHIANLKKSKNDYVSENASSKKIHLYMSIWILNTNFFAKTQLEKLDQMGGVDPNLYWENYKENFSGFVRIIEYRPGFGIQEMYEGQMQKGKPIGFGRFIKPGYYEMFIGYQRDKYMPR